jgi:hypothetical protein
VSTRLGDVITLSSTTPGASIRYTTNGSTPTEDSALYSSPGITITDTGHIIKAIAVKANCTNSDMLTEAYQPEVITPTSSDILWQPGATLNVPLSTATAGATIHYTLDGSTPTTSSATANGSISIQNNNRDATVTLKAIAVKTGRTQSDMLDVTLNIYLDGTYYLASYLQSFGTSTKETPITVKINRSLSIAGTVTGADGNYSYQAGGMGQALFNAQMNPSTKDIYFNLDLSGSTFTGNTEAAFVSCTNLISVILPNSVTTIGKFTFVNCTNLTSVTIPNGVTTIEYRAFSQSTITNVTIPDSVTSIDNNAFQFSDNIASITVDSDNPNYASQDGILYNKAKTEFIFIPPKISGAVTIPNSVASIGQSAFMNRTSLVSVTIPNSVTSIGQEAFRSCTSLISVTFATGSNIPDANFGYNSFPEGSLGYGSTLKTAYSTGKAGTYTRAAGGSTWTKSP